MRAVLIDDESSNNQFFYNMMSKYASNVEIVDIFETSADVLAHLKDSKPDVVFTNICMPDCLIFSLLDKLRPYTFDVVFVTAMYYEAFPNEVERFTPIGYLLKPVDPSELRELIHKLDEKYPPQ